MKTPNLYRSTPCPRCDGTGEIPQVNGEALRLQRERSGLLLRELARAIGVSAQYLCDVEYGRRTITAERLAQIIGVLGR